MCGKKYEVRGILQGPFGRRAEVVTVWIILENETFPRFVTAFTRGSMEFKELETVVLDRDLPDVGLRIGDLGAVVQVCEPDGLEVEFVTAAGRTQALVTVKLSDVRAVRDEDLIAVRTLTSGAA